MAFTYPLDEYSRDYDIVSIWYRQMVDGLMRMMRLSREAAERHVKKALDDADFSKYVCRFTKRGENGDRKIVQCNLLDYLRTVDSKGLIMSPTMTTYLPPEVKKSVPTEVISTDQALRSKVKKAAQAAKQKGDTTAAQIGTGIQNSLKRLINSWSGAGLSPHTPLYLKSLHPTLTTMCRISTALATASVERLLSGTRYYHKPDRVIEDILNTVDTMSQSMVERAMYLYELKVPTVDELMVIVNRSTEFYWDDAKFKASIHKLLSTLRDWERVAFAYSGDFYHLFLHNKTFTKEMLSEACSEDNGRLKKVEEYALEKLDEDQEVLLTNLIGEEIKGKKLHEALEENTTIKIKANKIANNLLHVFEDKYRHLIETFFRVPTFPIDTARQDKAIRRTVPLGDTDSTVYTTKTISELFYGRGGFDVALEPINDVMVYFVNGVIANALGNFTGQLNVPHDRRKLLVMKNEFKFPTVQITPVAKTYHAHVKAEEGNVYKDPQWEMKGQRFHAGRGNRKIVGELHEWMKEGKLKLNNGERIDRGELVDMICGVEHDLQASLSRKDDVYYEFMKIKPIEEYNKPMSEPWGKHRMYELMFSNTHGKAPEPTYTAYKIPLLFPSGFMAWFDSLSSFHQTQYRKWVDELSQAMPKGKAWPLDKAPTFTIIPTEALVLHGLPEPLKGVVDLRKLAGTALDSHYLNLGSMGINLDYESKGKGLLLSQAIETDDELSENAEILLA